MQGVPVTYADIFNTRALVEVATKSSFSAEPSYGTHFFQDLVEAQIYPLAVYPEEAGDHLNMEFINKAENQMRKFISELIGSRQMHQADPYPQRASRPPVGTDHGWPEWTGIPGPVQEHDKGKSQ